MIIAKNDKWSGKWVGFSLDNILVVMCDSERSCAQDLRE